MSEFREKICTKSLLRNLRNIWSKSRNCVQCFHSSEVMLKPTHLKKRSSQCLETFGSTICEKLYAKSYVTCEIQGKWSLGVVFLTVLFIIWCSLCWETIITAICEKTCLKSLVFLFNFKCEGITAEEILSLQCLTKFMQNLLVFVQFQEKWFLVVIFLNMIRFILKPVFFFF